MTGPVTLVVVPTYNERSNLPVLTEGLMRWPDVQLLVVDDHSPDGTGDVADALARNFGSRIRVLHREGPRGLGRSYRDGFRHAVQEAVDLVCQMDADLSHNPAELPTLVSAAADADLVIGSRYVSRGAIVNWPLRRRLLSRFANGYVRTITRLPVHDCTSGYRCWRRSILAALPLARVSSEGYAFLVETLYLAAQGRSRITEVPITFVERRQGSSKLSLRVLAESAATPWRLIRQQS